MSNDVFEYAVTEYAQRLPAQAYATACQQLSGIDAEKAGMSGLSESVAISVLHSCISVEEVVRAMLHDLLTETAYEAESVPIDQAYADALPDVTSNANPFQVEMNRIVGTYIR